MNQYVNDFNNTVKIYHKELKKYSSLTKEEEKTLFNKIKKNNKIAKNKIITSNLKFVFNVAKTYKGCGVPLEDLISEGNIGLIKAIDRFDETKDIKFISYAVWWIKSSIQEFIMKNNNKENYETNHYDDLNYNLSSNYKHDEEDEVVNFTDTICSNKNDYEEKELNKNQKIVINHLLKKLSPQGRDIIELYFGLNNKKELTLENIGKKYNLSIERIRQIKDKNIRIMRSELLLMNDMHLLFK